jgi:putative flippase GtrA
LQIFQIVKLRTFLIQFFKFGIVGLSNTAISYAIYSVLVYIELHYLIASTIAFFISVLNSFFWNNKYVFKKDENQKRNIFHSLIKTYISYAFTGLILSNLFLFLFIDILHISKYLAPFLGMVVTIPLNFILNKKWAFRSENKDKQNNEENQHTNTLL